MSMQMFCTNSPFISDRQLIGGLFVESSVTIWIP